MVRWLLTQTEGTSEDKKRRDKKTAEKCLCENVLELTVICGGYVTFEPCALISPPSCTEGGREREREREREKGKGGRKNADQFI